LKNNLFLHQQHCKIRQLENTKENQNMSFKTKLFNNALQNAKMPAVTSHGSTWNYETLLKHSENIKLSVNNLSRVGLYFEKSKEYILALFSITLSDTAYVPLELISPKERLEYIINDSEIDTIITSLKYSEVNLAKIPSHINVIYIEDLMTTVIPYTQPSPEKLNEPSYVIYTSGSTGNPKGVEVSFNGLSNVIEQQIDIINIDKSKFYLYLAISFDASLSDIYCSLLSNSDIHIYDCLKRDALGLQKYFNEVGITHSDLPPSLLKLLNPENFKTLQSVIIGGEVADYKSVQSFTELMRVVNVYGPTEATICTSMIVCDKNWFKPLIGLPLDNVGYKIIDSNNNEIKEINVNGELIITGCQLANGYLNNKEMNADKFITLFDERSYKTGDLVSYNSDGLIEFKGRVDRQIKYHGQLICLEEIESAINSIPAIKSVTVLFKNKKMYAYYEGDIKSIDIRVELKVKLPVYMIPTFIINKDIPKTVTGKNDGKLLAKQSSENEELQIIADVFRKILKSEELQILPTDSFIHDLGGDSLDFIQLHMELQQMGINIQYDYLIEHNSINKILNYNQKEIIIDTNFLDKEFEKLSIPKKIRKINKQENKVAMLTGSTGFLGSALLAKLLNKYEVVHCIVRGNNTQKAKERLMNVIKANKITIEESKLNKINIILGDVSETKLGLTEEEYSTLSLSVDSVYHCAANVNNILTYAQLYKANVLSTVNIAEFIFEGRGKELHYASTLSVYVSSDKLNNSVFNEEPLSNDGHRLYSGYAQTKWLSEYYLNQINAISGNVYSYRFGLLTPSIVNFISTPNSFLSNCINDLKNIGEIPESHIELSMDITPLEVATNAMFNISISDDLNRIFHITTNYQLTLSEIASILNIKKVINVETWFEKYNSYSLSQHMTDLNNPYTKQYNMNLFETTNVKFFKTDNSNKYIIDFDINQYLSILIS
jgi:amino acid adenylation domain-containing protein/thioester reductase-like protein